METGAAVPYSGNPNLNASREPGHNFKVMKKFILCLLAVAAGMSAFGQGRVMGVRAGLNVTSIDLSAGSNSFSFDSRASYNVGFAYLTVACIDAETFAANLPLFFATYILGSLAFNGVCVLLMKPAKALAVKSVQRTQSEIA